MKLRNVNIDESIKSQFKKALEDEHTVLDPTTADALQNEKDVRKQLDKDFKENDKAADDLIKATAPEEKTKVKNRKELTKLLSENKNRRAKISRCLDEGFRYLVEWMDEEEKEPKVQEEACKQEENCKVEEEVITEESNYDKVMKVINEIGNDAQEESLKEDNSAFHRMFKKRDDEEQFIQQMVCQLYSKFSDMSRSTIYDLVANLKKDFPEKDFDGLYEIVESAIVDKTADDYLDTGNTEYLKLKNESLEEDKKGKIGKGTVGEAINKNRNKIDELVSKNKTEMVRAVSKILEDDSIEDKAYAKEVLRNVSKKRTSQEILIYLYDIMLKQIGLGSPDAPDAKKQKEEEPAEEKELLVSNLSEEIVAEEKFKEDDLEGLEAIVKATKKTKGE